LIRAGDGIMVTRRVFLEIGAAGLALAAIRWSTVGPSAAETFAVNYSEDEWHKRLTPNQYPVLRQAATETPFTSPLLHEERRGNFGCAGCDLDLFSSTTKFDSGTGWPSFWAPLDKAVGTTRDSSFGMLRTAVHCSRCGGHLGHVFPDGPKPTGLRYCINGVAMTFKPATA
jgi:peptide-methionine (R)-S-oxide reductase